MKKAQRTTSKQLAKEIRRALAAETAYQQRRAMDTLADAINALWRWAPKGSRDPDPERDRRLWEVATLRAIADGLEQRIPGGPKR